MTDMNSDADIAHDEIAFDLVPVGHSNETDGYDGGFHIERASPAAPISVKPDRERARYPAFTFG